ncbi:hypothetical protein [Amycolatopsis speibonae]|uniref:DUF4333 domain-containing protein n=1 Tax=Amycolatopsis speibonae TaxID=1450224 RepID=A0ABV7P8V1_9PSEU
MTSPQQPPIWQQHPVAPPKKVPKTSLIFGVAAVALIVSVGGIAVTVALATGGGAEADSDVFSAQPGDCLSADENAKSDSEFSSSAVRVHCSDEAADYTVIAHLRSEVAADCKVVTGHEHGNPVVYDLGPGAARELCLSPKS